MPTQLVNSPEQINDALSLPVGIPQNYKIVPSVSGGILLVAVKALNGNDPTPNNPIMVTIGDVKRTITSPLSVTKGTGTNWCNLGGAELATKETDLFLYMIWNTNLGAVDVFFSRIPYGTLYSDFSATTTNEKYAAINGTAPAPTDSCACVGRFAASLSTGTSYTWSVPTYTSSNLIQRPIYETRWLSYVPQDTGYSANPTYTASYKVVLDLVFNTRLLTANGTSNATTATTTLPFKVASSSNAIFWIGANDNGALQTTPGHAQSSAASNSLSLWKTFFQGTWTALGTKGCTLPDFVYRIS